MSRHFGCPLRFDAERAEFRIRPTLLELPLTQADSATASLLERSCQELLTELQGETDLRATISHALLASPGALPNAADMAGRLNLGVRTMRRRLQKLGSSYGTLLRETRREIAEQHLRHGAMGVTELALNLGYADVAVFSRNFKCWTGLSPRQWQSARSQR